MLKPRASCAICQLITADPELERRINRSKKFIPGGESLLSIFRAYDGAFSQESLYNHTTRHQAPKPSVLKKQIKQFETKTALKDIEAVDDVRTVAVYAGQAEARTTILDKAMKALEAGDVKLTMSSIVALLGQEQKAEENAKDRGLKMMEMFNYFASGAGGPAREQPIEGELVQ